MTAGIFAFGPQGRSIEVDASGRLVTTGDSEGGLYTYSFGPQGRPLVVDASGRLVISSVGSFDISGDVATPIVDVTISGATPVDLSQSNIFYGDMEPSGTFSFSNPGDGGKYIIVLEQNDAGNGEINWPSNFVWQGGTAPSITATSGARDVVTFVYDSKRDLYYADIGQDFS